MKLKRKENMNHLYENSNSNKEKMNFCFTCHKNNEKNPKNTFYLFIMTQAYCCCYFLDKINIKFLKLENNLKLKLVIHFFF